MSEVMERRVIAPASQAVRDEDDKMGLRIRRRLLAAGILTPGDPAQVGFLSRDQIKKLKEKYIKLGLLVPGDG